MGTSGIVMLTPSLFVIVSFEKVGLAVVLTSWSRWKPSTVSASLPVKVEGIIERSISPLELSLMGFPASLSPDDASMKALFAYTASILFLIFLVMFSNSSTER
ncbi:hypothetical protein NLC27_03900 [Candidatus Aminicenantes bacterium AC-708-I09]|nr:hypothetical protein [Candidatus Aminicenantes bacterium AC-708-I09]